MEFFQRNIGRIHLLQPLLGDLLQAWIVRKPVGMPDPYQIAVSLLNLQR